MPFGLKTRTAPNTVNKHAKNRRQGKLATGTEETAIRFPLKNTECLNKTPLEIDSLTPYRRIFVMNDPISARPPILRAKRVGHSESSAHLARHRLARGSAIESH